MALLEAALRDSAVRIAMYETTTRTDHRHGAEVHLPTTMTTKEGTMTTTMSSTFRRFLAKVHSTTD